MDYRMMPDRFTRGKMMPYDPISRPEIRRTYKGSKSILCGKNNGFHDECVPGKIHAIKCTKRSIPCNKKSTQRAALMIKINFGLRKLSNKCPDLDP
jgi:hypothetical protein